MTLVSEELEKVKAAFLKQGPGVGRWEYYNRPLMDRRNRGELHSTMLRFDTETAEGLSFEEKMDTIFDLLNVELEDLIENGDMMQTHDALLKAMDGAKKRGTEAKEVNLIGNSLFYDQFRRGKEEFVFYCVLNVEWA